MSERLRVQIADLTASSDYHCCDGLVGLHAPGCLRLAPPHTLTEYGTTNCPVEHVRANVDDGECSACGAPVGIAP